MFQLDVLSESFPAIPANPPAHRQTTLEAADSHRGNTGLPPPGILEAVRKESP